MCSLSPNYLQLNAPVTINFLYQICWIGERYREVNKDPHNIKADVLEGNRLKF